MEATNRLFRLKFPLETSDNGDVTRGAMNETTLRLGRRAIERVRGRRGQTLVEYALILAFISVVAISTMLSMGTQLKGTFSTVTSQLATAKTGGSASGGSGSGSGSGTGTTGG